MADSPSYHDLHITLPALERTSIFNLPYNVEVGCSRVTGWEVWDTACRPERLLAGEYDSPDKWLILDVAGHVIVNSRDKRRIDPETGQVWEPTDG
jgi:hypothetical protein